MVATGSGYLLVDTGRMKNSERILERIDKIRANKPLQAIILTHTHIDHIQNLEWLVERYKVPVLVHDLEVHRLKKYNLKDSKVISIHDDYDLKVFGVKGNIFHIPGHTEGSVAIVIGDYAIVGDGLDGFCKKPHTRKLERVSTEVMESWQVLLDLKCQYYIASHGRMAYTYEELKCGCNALLLDPA